MHSPQHATRALRPQRGSIVLYLVVTLAAFGVLALAGATRFGASIVSVFSPSCSTQARLMSESGMRYALARLRMATDQTTLNTYIAAMNGTSYTVDAAKGQSFSISISYPGGSSVSVTSAGQSCTGSLFSGGAGSSQVSQTVNLPSIGGGGTPGEGVNFSRDITGFKTTGGFSGTAGITVNVGTATITLGNSVYANSDSVWYTGSRDVCTNGNCTLGNGLCAYYEFQFTAGSTGDGFVWTIMSGDTNTNASNGGYTGMGELLGYGGLGSSGLGIQPPKLGLEFDIWNNGCVASACAVNSRCDATTADHAAFIFWGGETLTGPLAGCTSATFDDNRHGAGAGSTSQPQNANNSGGDGDGTDGYYYRGSNTWLKTGGLFKHRYELDRMTTTDASGNYYYQLRAWVKAPADVYPTGMNNCTTTYSGAPEMTTLFTLTPAVHAKLTKVFFGWTEGTGGATQIATLQNFNLAFKPVPTVSSSIPKDYVAYWSMYEANGTTVHDMNATNANDGTINGAALWVPGVSCPYCAALRFTGANYVRVPDKPAMRLTTAGTIALWVDIQTYADWAGLVHRGVNSSFSDETYSLQFTTGRNVVLYLNSAASSMNSGSINLPNNNQWYHVAVTWDAATVKTYLNGALVNSVANTVGAAKAGSPDVILGSQLPTAYYFKGILDEVYLYNRALSATEISKLAKPFP